MLNVDLVGRRKPEFRAIRVIRVQNPEPRKVIFHPYI